jgi:hypothetical protein
MTARPQDFPFEPLEDRAAAGNSSVGSASPEDSPAVAPVGPWRRLQLTEPVRLYLRPVLVALVGLAVAYGLVDDAVAPYWEALAAALLAVGGHVGIETVRAAVWSERSATRAALLAGRAAAAAEREHALSLTLRAAVAARSERFPLNGQAVR